VNGYQIAMHCKAMAGCISTSWTVWTMLSKVELQTVPRGVMVQIFRDMVYIFQIYEARSLLNDDWEPSSHSDAPTIQRAKSLNSKWTRTRIFEPMHSAH
jgi:hypothetical protein